MVTNDLQRLKVARSDAYRLLAACFYEPDRELFLEEQLGDNLGFFFFFFEVPADTPCRRLAESLGATEGEELLVEYSALFLGPFGAPAHPFGSVYLEKGSRLMGDSTMAVKKIYQQAGAAQEIEGPPDHIALELEFMNFLLLQQLAAEAAGDQAELAELIRLEQLFLAEMLASWTVPFANAIREKSNLDFYRALADLLVIFISSEVHRLEGAERRQA